MAHHNPRKYKKNKLKDKYHVSRIKVPKKKKKQLTTQKIKNDKRHKSVTNTNFSIIV